MTATREEETKIMTKKNC